MFVRDGMSTDITCTTPDANLLQVSELLDQKRVHQLPVVDPTGRLVGIVTDRDTRDASARGDFAKCKVESVMTEDPITISADDTLEDALMLLHKKRFGALPVVDEDQRVVGIFTRHDCLSVLVDMLGISEPGSRLDLHIDDPAVQLCRAMSLIAKHDATLVSAVLTRERGQSGRRLYVRMQTIDPTPIEKAMKRAQIEVLDPGH